MQFKDIVNKNDSHFPNMTLRSHIKELLFCQLEQKGNKLSLKEFDRMSYELKRKLKLDTPYTDPESLIHVKTLI